MTEYLRREQDRVNAILNNTNQKFYFETQSFSVVPDHERLKIENYIDVSPGIGLPLYVNAQRNDWGAQVVRENSSLIEAASSRHGIDASFVKAIIYTEVSRGSYGYFAEMLGLAKTLFPGNIDPKWAVLIPGADITRPADNIEVTAKLVSEIAKRLDDPSIENIYALYNSLAHDRTYVNSETKLTPYFAKLAQEQRAWENDNWSADDFSAGHCFPAGTPILMSDGNLKPIEEISLGDIVMAFKADASEPDSLLPRRVTRLFNSTTTEWLILTPIDENGTILEEIVVTPGHHFLTPDGDFKSIGEICLAGGKIVLANGTPANVRYRNVQYNNENAQHYELSGQHRVAHTTPDASSEVSKEGWKTYNFEVEDLHTYIAGGVRVHNKSVFEFLPDGAYVTWVGLDASGMARDMEYLRGDGVTVVVDGTNDAQGNTVRVTETLRIPSYLNGGTKIVQVRNFDASGAETSRQISSFEYDGSVIQLEQIGERLGSAIGTALFKGVKNNIAGQVAAGTIIGTLAQNLGELLQKGFDISRSVIDLQPGSSDPLTDALNITFKDFAQDFAGNLQGQIIGQLSSFLMAELAEELDLDGFEGGLFTTIGGTITSQLLGNISELILNPDAPASTLLEGFSPGDLVTSVSGAVGGYLGSYLGSQVILPDNPQASIGTSIGSAVGSYIGSVLIPVPGLGQFIGSYVGSVLGTILGNALGQDSESWASVYFMNGQFIAGEFGANSTGDGQTFFGIASSQAKTLNNIVKEIGADAVSGGLVTFAQKGTTFVTVLANGQSFEYMNQHTPDAQKAWAAALEKGTMSLIKKLKLEGGDVFLRKAFANTSATNTATVVADLEVAKSYRDYVKNAEAINALIEATPNSTFALGWVLTLMKAKQLGLDEIKKLLVNGDADAETFKGTSLIDETYGKGGNDQLRGKGGNDLLYGGAGDDTIDGGVGIDRMQGDTGSDIYYVDQSSDIVVEAAGAGIDAVYASSSFTLSDNVENLTLLGAAISGVGNSLSNRIDGNDANNVIDGSWGDDTMNGGGGSDTYYVDSAGDLVIEAAGAGTDTVHVALNYMAGANIENLVLTGSAERGEGNELNNVITGNGFSNLLIGYHGSDTLDGGGGADRLFGGSGDDLYYVDTSADQAVEYAGEGVDTLISTIDITALAANIEHLELRGAAIKGVGNDLNNRIIGSSGANYLDGSAGVDTMIGGGGNDTYIVDHVGDIVSEAADQGIDTVRSQIDYTLTDNVENLILTGAALSGTGNNLNNEITGTTGDNMLSGGTGTDTLIGGAGNDIYYADAVGDAIREEADHGIDLVYASTSFILRGNVENLTLTGTAVTGTGNSLNNEIIGNSNNNVLMGNLGADTLNGAEGDDTASYRQAYTGVVANLADSSLNTGEAAGDIYIAIENLLGSTHSDTLTGDVNDNILVGYAGDDILDGGIGADTLTGGIGDDTYYVDDNSDTVSEGQDEGIDLVYSIIDHLLADNVENLTLIGQAVEGIGNALDNIIIGNGESNVLDGGAGVDTMVGGQGADTYFVDHSSDVIQEDLDAGYDNVWSSADYRLSANLEKLTLTGTAVTGIGNDIDNFIIGSNQDNTLIGGLGADTLHGNVGYDTASYIYASSGVTASLFSPSENTGEASQDKYLSIENLTGSQHDDILTGGDGSVGNTLTGLNGNDILDGRSGDDILRGGAGYDTMIGGLGDDSLYVDHGADVLVEYANEGYDTVYATISFTISSNIEKLVLLDGASQGIGNEGDNRIDGNSSDNILDGSLGADTLAGGLGNDIYFVDNSSDLVLEREGEGYDVVYASADYISVANVEQLYLVGGAIRGTGDSIDNWIKGNDLDNILDGGQGADDLLGGLGNDIYYVDNVRDIVSELSDEGTDTVYAQVDFSLGSNVENLVLTGLAYRGIGNGLDNYIKGNGANNLISGGGGSDTLDGGSGADTLGGGSGNDIYYIDISGDTVIEQEGAGIDTVYANYDFALGGNIENLVLTGRAEQGLGDSADNMITGNGMNNTLNGGAGADTLIGGIGHDVYYLDSSGDVVLENASEGFDTIYVTFDYTLESSFDIESVVLIGNAQIAIGNKFDNSIVGSERDNTLSGGAGADTLDGGRGDDSLIGGTGDDEYIIDSIGDMVFESAAEGVDTIRRSVEATALLADYVENLVLQGSAITGRGNSLDNYITGNDLGNVLNGYAGTDTIVGGFGDDVYILDGPEDLILEYEGQGRDTVYVNNIFFYTLLSHFEDLVLGSSAIKGKGNSLDNLIVGNDLDNILSGMRGNDTLIGGLGADEFSGFDGVDTVTYESAKTGVIVNLKSLSENAGEALGDTYSGIEVFRGSNFGDKFIGDDTPNVLEGLGGNDSLEGGGYDDTLIGGSGNDTLNGGWTGTDRLVGGIGDDVYVISYPMFDVIVEYAGEGHDRVETSYSLTLPSHVEDARLINNSIKVIGNELNNYMYSLTVGNTMDGGAGNDTLSGSGANTLIGGSGNDVFWLTEATDTVLGTVIELENGGIDTIRTWALNVTLAAGVENLILERPTTRTATTTAHGNNLNNNILGTAGNDALWGEAGNDTIDAGAGNDTLHGGSGADVLMGGDGDDHIYGDSEDNARVASVLIGGAGDDILAGGAGQDTLIGGTGADTFQFEADPLSLRSASVIEDFTQGEDKIVLKSERLGLMRAAEIDFLVGSVVTEKGAAILYDAVTGSLSFDKDGIGGESAVQLAILSNKVRLTASDVLFM